MTSGERYFAPFCSNPACSCACADDYACSAYVDDIDSSGAHRCGACGRPAKDHR